MKRTLLAKVPLSTLRYVESAIRLENLEATARELNVSASAVSQQVAKLEAILGCTLFRRDSNKIFATGDAKKLGAALGQSLDAIETALQQADTVSGCGTFRIKVFQTMSNRWLIPRLSPLMDQYPKLKIEIETGMGPVNLQREDLDAAIAASQVPGGNATATPLLPYLRQLPVCSPQYARTIEGRKFGGMTLISSRNRLVDWPRWLGQVGINDDGLPSMVFGNSTSAYEAAVAGTGIVIAFAELVVDDLEAGRLVAPFEHVMRTEKPVVLFERQIPRMRKNMEAIRTWLLKEAELLASRTDRVLS